MVKRSRMTLFVHALPLLLLVLPLLALSFVRLQPVVRTDPVTASLQRAVLAGGYRFQADALLVSDPVPSMASVGQAPERHELFFRGHSNLKDDETYLRLWTQGGNVSMGDGSVELRISEGTTLIREGEGPWEEHQGLGDLYAPGGDLLGYLTAVREIELLAHDAALADGVTRYGFRIDGPALALYLRDQQQEALIRANRLPAHVQLQPNEQYNQLDGSGELWVDAAGLPVRQILHLRLPATGQQGALRAHFTMDLTVNDPPASGLSLGFQAGLVNMINGLSGLAPTVASFLFAFWLMVSLIIWQGSRRLANAMALVLITALVVSPLATAQRVHAFQAEQTEELAQQQPNHAVQPVEPAPPSVAEVAAHALTEVMLSSVRSEAAGQVSDDGLWVNTSSFAPAGDTAHLIKLAQLAEPVLPNASLALTHDDGRDSDGDGLTDFQERFLGTNPFHPDTDGDGLTDFQEVVGFEHGGRRWYLDPRSKDTNGDGIIDSLEVEIVGDTIRARDTNGNGIPDAFDRDNDGDGVPDLLDLSPNQHSIGRGAFNNSSPFWLKLDNLSFNRPVTIDFQVRPQNAQQLWYAQSSFDWPADHEGQIQNRNYSRGDVQILPMLEITVPPNSRATLPPHTPTGNGNFSSDELGAQGVTLRQADADALVAYVPLNMVSDPQTGARVALMGRMLYRGSPSWGSAHRIRLVWAVQMRNDLPDGRMDVPSIIQVYDNEAWFLTGLQVREDHGITGGLFMVDPAAQADAIQRDDTLFAFINSLETTFLRGRTDLTPADLVRRFNRLSNMHVPSDQRWGLPNTMRAEYFSYSDPLSMVRDLGGQRNRNFVQHVQAHHEPIVLNLRTEQFRALNLNSVGSNASWHGTVLTLDLPRSGARAVQLQTNASVNLNAYEFSNGAWQPLRHDQIVQRFIMRHQPQTSADEELRMGQLALLRNYVAVLVQGVSSMVSFNESQLFASLAHGDALVAQTNAAMANIAAGALKHANAALGPAEGSDTNQQLKLLGSMLISLGKTGASGGVTAWKIAGTFLTSFSDKAEFAVRGAIIGALLMGVTLIIAAQLGSMSPELNDWLINGGLDLVQHVVINVAAIVQSVVKLVVIARTIMNSGIEQVINTTPGLNIFIGVLTIGATVGFAIYQAIANQLSGVALAQLIITTTLQVAWTILLIALSFIPKFGLIIVAVIALIDAVLSIILSLILGRATTFSTWIFEQIARFIVDESRYLTVRPQVTHTSFGLVNPSMGMTSQNILRFSGYIEPNLGWNPNRIGNRWWGRPWSDQEAWSRVSGTVNFATHQQNLNAGPSFPPISWRYHSHLDLRFAAGLNRATEIWLNTAFNLPLKRCIFLWCGSYDDTQRYNTRIADRVVFDILPANLDEFFAMAFTGSGHRLAWDGRFPELPDADFDGVARGMDPNDRTWDADGDGLSDAFELEAASRGLRFDPRQRDTDGDGLSDLEEAILGTDPARRDTDGDGLSDFEEVNGFMMNVSGRMLLLRTNPLLADSNGDGISDFVKVRQSDALAERSRMAHWPLNEAGPNRFADRHGGLALTCVPTFHCPTAGVNVAGRTGVRFDGNNHQLTASADERFRMRDEFTFGAWIYRTSHHGGMIFNREGEYQLAIFPGGGILWAIANSRPGWTWVYVGADAPLNQWVHVGWTYNHGTVSTYINGNLVHTHHGAGTIGDVSPDHNELRIGGRSALWQPFIGLISDVHVFNRALPAGDLRVATGLQAALADEQEQPVEANLAAAIGIFPEIDDPDLVVHPGQNLVYTVTLRHNLDEGQPIRGTVWLNTPAGGLPSSSFELLPGAVQTFGTNLTVPNDAPEGTFTLDTMVQYSLNDEQTAIWTAPALLTQAGNGPRALALAATAGAQPPYALATEADGQVRFYATQADALPEAIALGAGTAPAVACDSAGCLVSWLADAQVQVRYVAEGNAAAPLNLGAGSSPAVASRNNGFLVAWLDDGALRAQRFAQDGTPQGEPLNLGVASAFALSGDSEGYLALYERGPAEQRDLWMLRVSDDAVGSPQAVSAAASAETAPALAFSSAFTNTLATYMRDGSLFGRIISGTMVGPEVTLLSDSDGALVRPVVAAGDDHFVVAAGLLVDGRPSMVYQAVAANGSLLGSKQLFAWAASGPQAPNIALACRSEQPCLVGPAGLAGADLQVASMRATLLSDRAGLVDRGVFPMPLTLTVDRTPPVAQILSLQDGDYLPAANLDGGLVLGGTVSDTNLIELIEVSVNNGAWQPAEGDTAWFFNLDVSALAEGAHTLRVRARDVAQNQGQPSAPLTVIVDRGAPDLTVNTLPSELVRPQLDAQGAWGLPLTGTLADPAAGNRPGSGSNQLVLQLLPADAEALITVAQEVTATNGLWQHFYRLAGPSGLDPQINPPTGSYTFTMNAADAVGNVREVTATTLVRVDATPPQIELEQPGELISTTQTLRGTLSDPGSVASGVQQLEVAFVPAEQVELQQEAGIYLPFEEPLGSQVFHSAADGASVGACDPATCPTLRVDGRIGQGLTLLPAQQVQLADRLGEVAGLSLVAWIDGSGSLFMRGEAGSAGFVEVTTSRVRLQGTTAACELPFSLPAASGWQHFAATYDGTALAVYHEGSLVATSACDAGSLPEATAQLSGFSGSLDEVAFYGRGLEAEEVGLLAGALEATWLNASLANPGATTSAWTLTVPEGLDGFYAMMLRASDVLGNQSIGRDGSLFWRGIVDTAAPRLGVTVAQQGSGDLARTLITCQAYDINLDSSTLDCVVPAGTILDEQERFFAYEPPAWQRLGLSLQNGMERTIVVAGHSSYSAAATVCDRFGRCVTATPQQAPSEVAPLDLLVTQPSATVFTNLNPLALQGSLAANAGLRALTVSINDTVVHQQNWDAGVLAASFNTTWTPGAEGRYTLLVVLEDQQGERIERSQTLFVDIAAPTAIAFAQPVITSTAIMSGVLALPINVSDTGVITSVQGSLDNTTWIDAGLFGQTWYLPVLDTPNMDGASLSYHLRASDAAGRTIEALNQQVIIDVTPPAPLELILETTTGQALATGDVVRTPGVGLRMRWPAGSDGSGTVSFWAGWSEAATPEQAQLNAYGAGAGSHSLDNPSEARAYYAHLIQRDAHGNQTIQTAGPIIFDTPLTPNLISQRDSVQPEQLVDTGWMASDCALVGQNSALARRSNDLAANNAVQQLFATWDDQALRLAWRGTIWGEHDDLYIYLDSAEGGATVAYSEGMPAGQPEGRMPDGFRPNLLLRVDNPSNASLLRWNGSTWLDAGSDVIIWPSHERPDQLEIYLPFTSLGLNDPANSDVGLLAYATEANSLNIWSIMPANNPLTSARVLNSPSSIGNVTHFRFTDIIFWEHMGAGVCPSDEQFLVDIRFTLSADPIGSIYSLFTDENIEHQALLLDGPQGQIASLELPHFDYQHPLLFDGQVITYTVHYENIGEVSSQNLRAWIINWDALRIPNATLVYDEEGIPYYELFLELGDLAPGASGSTSFTGVVDRAIAQHADENEDWATLDISFHDDSTGLEYAIDWFFIDHPVDILPPEFIAIETPERFVAPGAFMVEGLVWDESDVPDITIELRFGSQVRQVNCSDPTPDDGEWSCLVDPGNLADDTAISVRARATDAGGHVSDWSEVVNLRVDATAPRLVLSDATAARLALGSVSFGNLNLAGRVVDERAAAAVEICLDRNDSRGLQCEVVVVGSDSQWHYLLPIDSEGEGRRQQVQLTPIDEAGNRGATQSYSYIIDITAPTLSGQLIRPQMLPANAISGSNLRFTGTYSDAVSVVGIRVRIEQPDGTSSIAAAELQSGTWSYNLTLQQTGEHRIFAEARDAAGNVRMIGPIIAGGPLKVYLPLVMREGGGRQHVYLPFVQR
ncbi:LamG-like jellyroll fold domain-containing protein [Candidatus Viridilinea mediisalina]|uniref:LamG-like jellyroll fold domain-containing protein n=1 Tax=Candidatus Viridilinea mediisalina TaxID=2024553 RepID=A0A2A6RFS2_9CHLR|nr:LamG-like jellyroll fold domain-containing protein [Candidatus Viridilinea mediisalina]PDW01781.1 hypothetical protein CJ255_17330 [Candidatus Viridilinea mediisalina]